MTAGNNFRTVLLDSVNRKKRPVLGVRYTVFVDGKPVFSATKASPGPQKLSVEAVGKLVVIQASLPGWEDQTIELGANTDRWEFEFKGAGVPRILVVCALPKETTAVLATCDYYEKLEAGIPVSDPNTYYVGTFKQASGNNIPRRVLVATCGMGNIGAAITATHALRSCPDDVQQILMVGIAGGCPNLAKVDEHVRLGDIVVANDRGVIQYDFIKRKIDGDEHRANPHRPSKEMMDGAAHLEVQRLQGTSGWNAVIVAGVKKLPSFARPADREDVLHAGGVPVAHPADPDRQVGFPRVHRGGIGSANILLKDPAYRDMVRDKWGVKAIEMEGSGVLDAGWAMDMDVMIVRGVCDYADEYKTDCWQEYAALAAAAYARCLVLELPERVFP